MPYVETLLTCGLLTQATDTSFSESADQDDVFGCGAAGEEGWLAVAGEVEPRDLIGSEIGQLFWRTTFDRHTPDVRDSVAGDDVRERTAIGQPMKSLRNAGVNLNTVVAGREIKQLGRLAAFKWN